LSDRDPPAEAPRPPCSPPRRCYSHRYPACRTRMRRVPFCSDRPGTGRRSRASHRYRRRPRACRSRNDPLPSYSGPAGSHRRNPPPRRCRCRYRARRSRTRPAPSCRDRPGSRRPVRPDREECTVADRSPRNPRPRARRRWASNRRYCTGPVLQQASHGRDRSYPSSHRPAPPTPSPALEDHRQGNARARRPQRRFD